MVRRSKAPQFLTPSPADMDRSSSPGGLSAFSQASLTGSLMGSHHARVAA